MFEFRIYDFIYSITKDTHFFVYVSGKANNNPILTIDVQDTGAENGRKKI